MNGLILIDKPAGCTSHDVVNRLRKLAGTKRIGHLGTLDPMATGLLALLAGPATRLAPFFQRAEKSYHAVIKFGLISDTYDLEGDVKATGAALPSGDEVRAALGAFRGKVLQTPPPVSAKKIGGVPAYKLVRKQIPVTMKPTEVEITELAVKNVAENTLELDVTCSAGTYVRSVAHDLGELLGCGAILSQLRRTRVGAFSISDARTLDELAVLSAAGILEQGVILAGELLAHIPAERVSAGVEAQIRQGRRFRTSPFVVSPGAPLVRALSRSGDLIAIGKMVIPNLYQPSTVFQAEVAE